MQRLRHIAAASDKPWTRDIDEKCTLHVCMDMNMAQLLLPSSLETRASQATWAVPAVALV
jgi:hypothetical protein